MAYSTVKLYRENAKKEKFVVIYYKHQSNLRHQTTVCVKQKDFDNKAGRVKGTDKDSVLKNEIIDAVHSNIENIIESYILENGFKPSSDYVKNQLKLGNTSAKLKSEAELTDYYHEFLIARRIFFSNPDRAQTSIKDYKSTYNALLDYKAVVKSIPLNSLNSHDWLERFNQFLSKDRPTITNYKFLSTKQGSKTRHKRFVCLKVFAKWLSEKHIISTYEVLSKYRIRVIKNSHYALSLSEVKLLQETTFPKDTHQKAIDMFVFACHTGLRISDVLRVKKAMISEKDGMNRLEFRTHKTKEKAELQLTKKATAILEKYNYNLKLYSEPNVNKYLHEALKTLDGFSENILYGKDNSDAPKHELITFHTGRRTFITSLVNNNVNLNAIMKMTGHKRISTLQEYINPDYNLTSDNIKVLNDL